MQQPTPARPPEAPTLPSVRGEPLPRPVLCAADVAVEELGSADPRLDDYLVPGCDGFEAWSRHWRELEPGERDPLAHPALLAAWMRHLALPSGRDFRLFVCRAPGGEHLAIHPAAVLPARVAPGCLLQHDPEFYLEDASLSVAAADRDAVLGALLRHRVRGAGRVRGLSLGRVDGTNGLLTTPGSVALREGHRSIIDLRRGWEGVEERLSKNFRRNLRKAENKLERLDGVRHETAVVATDVDAAFDRLVEVEARSWKGEVGTSLADDAGSRRFWRDVLLACAPRGEAIVQVLVAEGVDVAAQLCLHIDDTLHVLKVAYDSEHGRLAPGNILLCRAMQGLCVDRDIRWMSLVTGLDWHDKWQPEELRTFRLLLLPEGLGGTLSGLLALESRDAARFVLARRGWLDAARRLRGRLRGVG